MGPIQLVKEVVALYQHEDQRVQFHLKLIAGPAGEKVLPGTEMIGLALLWAAAVLTLYTGWDYMKASARYVPDE